MFKPLKLTLCTLILLFVSVGHANAGLITYHLAGDSGDGAEGALLDNLQSGSVTKGGVTATLSTGNLSSVLNQTSSGFGINLLGDGCDESGSIDNNAACGQGYFESILFGFDRFVELVSITLTSYSPTDDAVLLFTNIATLSLFGSADLPSSPSTLLIGARVGGVGDQFLIGSAAGNGFSIDRITVRVPAPATLALFGLGLVGLSGMRRQRPS